MADTTALRARLTDVLVERDRLFPMRDPANTEAMKAAFAEYTTALESLRWPDWQPDAGLAARAREFLSRPIFICGEMKSGTTMLVNLLDNHPNLVVMPGDSHLLAESRHAGHTPEPGGEAAWRAYWLHRFVNPTGQSPFWLLGEEDEAYILFMHYLDYWLLELPRGPKAGFLAAVLAYYCANTNCPPEPRAWVEKTPLNEFRTIAGMAISPEAKFIHILRDGRDNLASIKKLYQNRNWPWNVQANVMDLTRSLRQGLANRAALGEGVYRLLRYEDLLADPGENMCSIADFLGIPYEPSLIQPTENGAPARTNSMYRQDQTTGQLLQSRRSRWLEELTAEEQDALLTHYYPYSHLAGYTWQVSPLRRTRAWVLTHLRGLSTRVMRRR